MSRSNRGIFPEVAIFIEQPPYDTAHPPHYDGSSTKNERRQRDPEMPQVKKGNEWHFGMKAHIGVDSHPGLVHSVTATAANEADICCTSVRSRQSNEAAAHVTEASSRT